MTNTSTPHHRGNRLAHDNVARRLLAHFGAHGGLEIKQEAEKYRVVVTVLMEGDGAYRHR